MKKYSNHYLFLRLIQKHFLVDGRLYTCLYFHDIDKIFIFKFENNKFTLAQVRDHSIFQCRFNYKQVRIKLLKAVCDILWKRWDNEIIPQIESFLYEES